ncbi:hypothetical protein DFA_11503 [Cavenderia fasciculata]|uniref:Uncharacterized protein n=1 Tax=Cavenderia fasciculata TaxID=261658 RepID=F4QDB4_CACFS|nr:uncharacterized protein DFA_11503 [Cavenderia fasciculata]EGG13742.1 hypothetical protein DFA_11503 [Cavenderia fasciculata]|eukprot:XP_004350446.1 hypothetical protein DFA_11503 [Cavenderia fasciculata]
MNSYEKRYQKKATTSTTPTASITSPSASPTKKATFSEAVVNKTDVGEFQEGYFIMSTADETLMRRPHINKNSPQRKKTQYTQQQQAPSNTTNDDKPLKPSKQSKSTEILLTPASLFVNDSDSTPSKKHLVAYSSSNNNSNYKSTPTSTTKSYNNNNNNNNFTKTSSSPVSPQSSSCWAGGAFNNSPAPNSLPIPNFDDWSSPQEPTPQFDLTAMTYDLRRLLNIQPDLVSAKTVA